MLQPTDFFHLSTPLLQQLFADCPYIWDILPHLGQHVARLTGNQQTILGTIMPGAYLSDRPLFIGEGAIIEPGAYLHGPAYIAPGAIVRHGAFVRENVILLEGSILGHASEAKNSLFLPHAHAPHFNYVGDSVLGQGVNLGAGTKLSNLSMLSDKDPATGKRPTIVLEVDGEKYDTGLAKMGAILGDGAQTGCNSVLNPGCVVAPGTLVYANLSLRKGYYPPHSLVKLRQETVVVGKRL
jgi:UDP-N-acetylglucosamine diphosphorylase / glucose-1-phosphate thymidylyltransferase / UDP-N-acetylgalactosamine diphosphorylase / glucosamine-1-phosphate N-acetyltransferase / galactosamine-1-phosphate N-acetyltransferase